MNAIVPTGRGANEQSGVLSCQVGGKPGDKSLINIFKPSVFTTSAKATSISSNKIITNRAFHHQAKWLVDVYFTNQIHADKFFWVARMCT